MNYFNRIALMLVAIILTGCAASGPKYSEMSATLPTLEKGKGRIYFYRTKSFFGAAVQPNIKLNDAVVGESKPGGFFFVDQTPGKYKVSTKTEWEKSLEFSLLKGEKKYIQTSVSMGVLVGHVTPKLVEKELAESALKELSYTGGAFHPHTSASAKKANTSSSNGINEAADETEIQKVEFKLGRSSYVVGEMAKKAGCVSNLGAGLITEQGPIEVYRMNCDSDEDEELHDNKKVNVFMARCEMRQCLQMKR